MNCPVCGNDVSRPMMAHRFAEGERIVSIVGRGGVIVWHRRWGYKVAWDNGTTSVTSPLALDHEKGNEHE